ncbi:hypothetical protein [Xanthomarina sp. GH4-25]
MKKNLLGAIVIVFVIFACLLVISEVNDVNASDVEAQQYYADSE